MPNNLKVGPNGVICKAAISFANIEATSVNTAVIYKIDTPILDYVPGRTINGISGFELGFSYYCEMKQAVDWSANLIPPISSGGGGGTAGVFANQFSDQFS